MKHFNVIRLIFASVVALSTLCATVAAQTVTVVEYRNKTLDAYFITGRVAEQQLLDTVADFSRTGMSFQANAAAAAPSALTKICRFYVSLTNPFVNSHFYGKQGTDCEAILAANPAGFSNEGFDFAVQSSTPGIGAAVDDGVKLTFEEVCPSGFTAVRRGFRALNIGTGKTSNHRYTVSATTAANASAAGYVLEGVQFCVTLFTDVVIAPVSAPPQKWVGTGASSSSVLSASAQVTWTLESYSGNVATYRPSGTASVIVHGCLIYSPDNGVISPSSGVMFVDYNSFPPTYHGSGITQWPTIATITCPNPPPPFSTLANAAYFGGSKGTLSVEAQGLVSEDGLTIEGADTNTSGPVPVMFNWYFARK